jgi:hypothetical protein
LLFLNKNMLMKCAWMEKYPTKTCQVRIRNQLPDAEASLVFCIFDCWVSSWANMSIENVIIAQKNSPMTIANNDFELNQGPAWSQSISVEFRIRSRKMSKQ